MRYKGGELNHEDVNSCFLFWLFWATAAIIHNSVGILPQVIIDVYQLIYYYTGFQVQKTIISDKQFAIHLTISTEPHYRTRNAANCQSYLSISLAR